MDYSKSNYSIVIASFEGVSGTTSNNYYANTLSFGTTHTITPTSSGYSVTGSCYITMNNNGDLTFNPGNCAWGYLNHDTTVGFFNARFTGFNLYMIFN